ncbi:DUF4339 domain-containing protein [bacterium]|nr:DUF4339 domain-containing protein [bacterium]
MDRWYAWVDNKIYGPYLPEQLGEFVRPETNLCREGMEEWKPAKDHPELAFILRGMVLETPPNVGWMVRKANTPDVRGPFAKSELLRMMDAGQIAQGDFIKHTGWDEWEPFEKTKLLHPESAEPDAETPPNPEEFHRVLKESTDAELLKEYQTNYRMYPRRERQMLKEELLRRGLIKKTFGLF